MQARSMHARACMMAASRPRRRLARAAARLRDSMPAYQRLRTLVGHVSTEVCAQGLDTERLRAEYEQHGVVCVPGVFSELEMTEIEEQLAAYQRDVMPGEPGPWDGHNFSCATPGDLSTVWRITNLQNGPSFFARLQSERLRPLFEVAVGAQAAPIEETATAIQFFDKVPGAPLDTPMHQDGGFTVPHITNGVFELAQVTIVIDAMDEANGGLSFVRGRWVLALRFSCSWRT